ncbi:MAG: family 16 glycoside hydrolase [Fibrobacteria bacterium]
MRIPRYFSVSILLALLSSGLGYAQTINLKGRVVDKATLMGIPGATVTMQGGSLSAKSDSAGKFILSGTVGIAKTALGPGREPWFKDGALWIEAANDGHAKVDLFGAKGESLTSATVPLKSGMNRVDAFAGAPGDFAGYTRIRVGERTWVKPALRATGPVPVSWIAGESASMGADFPALAKAAATGNVEVSADKLLTKTVAYTASDADLGDIILDYPERKLGVGALPVHAATVLFDGSKGRAAAVAELQSNWQDWPRYTPSEIKFRVVRDPQFPSDTNRVSLQSCCNTLWGYDDIQAKVGLYEDCQIHVEWIGMGEYDSPFDLAMPNANASDPIISGQKGYINSGVYAASRYELQVQSFDTNAAMIPGIHDMASIVDQATPATNQNKPNGVWQAFDITYRGARFNGSNMSTQPYLTMWWNGVLVHDNKKLSAGAAGLSNHSGEEHNDKVIYGLKLQSEGRDVRYRNVWIKKLILKDEQTKVGY